MMTDGETLFEILEILRIDNQWWMDTYLVRRLMVSIALISKTRLWYVSKTIFIVAVILIISADFPHTNLQSLLQ